MRLSDLRSSVEQIQMDEKRKRQMIQELSDQYGNTRNKDADLKRRHSKKHNLHYIIKVAAAIFAVGIGLGALSIPVRALVSSFVAERMEELPQEEVETIVEQLDSQETEADSYTRELSGEEKTRRAELYEQYLNGMFPEYEIPQADSVEAAEEQEFCFLVTTSVFYLPEDRELTDEEILEIIDFEQKRDYALRQRYEEEYAEELAREEADKAQQIREVIDDGGITEQEAIEIATDYLQKIYSLSGNDMEINHYYDKGIDLGDRFGGRDYYCVNWSNNGCHQYYYFWISAVDGTLLEMAYSDASESVKPTIQEAPDRIANIKNSAERFLTEKLEINDTYNKVESCYLTSSTGRISGKVSLAFAKKDGTLYQIDCNWDGKVLDFLLTTEEAYEKRLEEELKYAQAKASEEIENGGENNTEVTVKVVRQ